MTPRIRRARPSDLSAILRIEKQAFHRGAWSREYFAPYLENPHRCVFLIAALEGKIVGYAVAVIEGAAAELDSIAVGTPFRGRGIAAKILDRLTRELARRNVAQLSLMVRIDNSSAIKLYRNLGFQRIRRVNEYYEDGDPGWRMRLMLRAT